MRTTIDLPDDLHRAVSSLARDRGQSLSRTVSDLVGRALRTTTGGERVSLDAATGLPLVRLGKPVTTDMVRAAVDEE
ncbi:MAG: antitoxin [Acidimicrobiales bacterium]